MNDLSTKKFSLKDHLAANQAAKHNSDLANIASKLNDIALERVQLDKQEAALQALAARIEGDEVVTVEEVRAAYEWKRGGR